MTDRARGVDVSRWQGSIDWTSDAYSDLGPVEFCIVKLSDGVKRAHRSEEHLDGLRETNVLPGVYHLWQPDIGGRAQADALLDFLPDWYGSGCLPPALDVETKAIDAPPLPADDVASMVAWADTVEGELRCKPILYISPRGIEHLERHFKGITWILPSRFDLWICDYTRVRDSLPSPSESPGPLSPWTRWTLWQYTSSLDGRDHGCGRHAIDGDLYNGSARELARYAQGVWR